MASQPLKRIYFDTNILYRWPHPPNDIYSVFGAAKWLGAQLFMPEVVEGELESQLVVSFRYACVARQFGCELRRIGSLSHVFREQGIHIIADAVAEVVADGAYLIEPAD